jgi:hypothetical protein
MQHVHGVHSATGQLAETNTGLGRGPAFQHMAAAVLQHCYLRYCLMHTCTTQAGAGAISAHDVYHAGAGCFLLLCCLLLMCCCRTMVWQPACNKCTLLDTLYTASTCSTSKPCATLFLKRLQSGHCQYWTTSGPEVFHNCFMVTVPSTEATA